MGRGGIQGSSTPPPPPSHSSSVVVKSSTSWPCGSKEVLERQMKKLFSSSKEMGRGGKKASTRLRGKSRPTETRAPLSPNVSGGRAGSPIHHHHHASVALLRGKENKRLSRKRKRDLADVEMEEEDKQPKRRKRSHSSSKNPPSPSPSIRPFRKSPIKTHPPELLLDGVEEEEVPGSSATRLKSSRKRQLQAKKKLDLSPSTSPSSGSTSSLLLPKDRSVPPHTIIPGDYLSHDRQYFHVRTNGRILHGEPESEESYEWLPDLMTRQIDEFLDLNPGEKGLIQLWNAFIIRSPAYGSIMLTSRLHEFVEIFGGIIAARGLYRNFILHLSNLCDHEVLDEAEVLKLVLRLQGIMAELKEAPWKDQWVEERELRKAVEPVDTPPKVQDIHPTLPPLSSLKSLPKKKKMKKHRAPSTEVPKESRRTSLRGTASAVVILKTRDSDVSVKFWGAGDYTSIKDAGEDRRRSWGRVEPRDLRHVIEAKRRRMSNGLPSINCTTCTEVT